MHAAGPSIHLEPVANTVDSLDPRYVFVLDTGLKIFLWNGKKSKNTLKSKARLFCEKIDKNERKNKAEIITETPGSETKEFWFHLGQIDGQPPEQPIKVVIHFRAGKVFKSFGSTLLTFKFLKKHFIL